MISSDRSVTIAMQIMLVHIKMPSLMIGLVRVRKWMLVHRIVMLNVGCSVYDWWARVIDGAMVVVGICYGLVVRLVVRWVGVSVVTVLTVTLTMVNITRVRIGVVPMVMIDVVFVTMVIISMVMIVMVLIGGRVIHMVVEHSFCNSITANMLTMVILVQMRPS